MMRDKVIKYFTFWVPIKSLRRKIREYLKNFFNNQAQKEQKKKIVQFEKNIKRKIKLNEKVKVGFLCIFDSVFQYDTLFEEMMKSDVFDPYIVVIPDVIRGEEHKFSELKKTYSTFKDKYENVLSSYDSRENKFIDISKEYEIVFFCNPYDVMTHKYYTIEYLKDYTLCAYESYYYFGKFKYDLKFLKIVSLNFLWKIFVENENSKKLFLNKNKKFNIEVSGYSKMDRIRQLTSNFSAPKNKRKLIIISPHHTVRRIKNHLNLSTFLRYYNFYLELPRKFPEIDFIFRPHPLLFSVLEQSKIWNTEQIAQYISKIDSIPNMKYQDGGEYFETFVESDALIHDCGSFLAEYLYTDKPQCFLLENQEEIDNEFLPFGKELLEVSYKAYNEKEIMNFINNVVINKNDIMKKKRLSFSDKYVKINYGVATKSIIETIIK